MIVNPVVQGSDGGLAIIEVEPGETSITVRGSGIHLDDFILLIFTPHEDQNFFAIFDFNNETFKSSMQDQFYISDVNWDDKSVEIEYEAGLAVAAYIIENSGIPIAEM